MIRAMASLIRNYSAPTFHLYKQKPALSGAERIGKGSRYFLVGPLCAKAETIASNASIAKSLATTSSAFCTSRALMLVAVAAAAATFGVDHAKASKLRALKQRRERSNHVSRRSAYAHHRGNARFVLVRQALMPSQHRSPRSRGSASRHRR